MYTTTNVKGIEIPIPSWGYKIVNIYVLYLSVKFFYLFLVRE